MNLYDFHKPDESNPLLLPELVTIVLTTIAGASLVALLLGILH